MSCIEVYPIRSKVNFGKDNDGIISEILIQGDSHVLYKVLWYDNDNRYSCWLEDFEVTLNEEEITEDTKKMLIAFK